MKTKEEIKETFCDDCCDCDGCSYMRHSIKTKSEYEKKIKELKDEK